MGHTTTILQFGNEKIDLPREERRSFLFNDAALKATNGRLVENVEPREREKTVDSSGNEAAGWAVLRKQITGRLIDRLTRQGMGPIHAGRIAGLLADDFREGGGIPSRDLQGLESDDLEALFDGLADQLADGVGKLRALAEASFGKAALLALPSKAPAVWQKDRRAGETSIDFLRRVWGPWIRGEALHQDDIKRLGDSRLVQAVRSYCHRHDLEAGEILPPPKKEKLERALAAMDPSSPAATALRARIDHRKVVSKRKSKMR